MWASHPTASTDGWRVEELEHGGRELGHDLVVAVEDAEVVAARHRGRGHHPARVAPVLLTHQPHARIVGEGADDGCDLVGVPVVDDDQFPARVWSGARTDAMVSARYASVR